MTILCDVIEGQVNVIDVCEVRLVIDVAVQH